MFSRRRQPGFKSPNCRSSSRACALWNNESIWLLFYFPLLAYQKPEFNPCLVFRHLCLHALQNAWTKTNDNSYSIRIDNSSCYKNADVERYHRGFFSVYKHVTRYLVLVAAVLPGVKMDYAVPVSEVGPKNSTKIPERASRLRNRAAIRGERCVIRSRYKHADRGCVQTACAPRPESGSAEQPVRFRDSLILITCCNRWHNLINVCTWRLSIVGYYATYLFSPLTHHICICYFILLCLSQWWKVRRMLLLIDFKRFKIVFMYTPNTLNCSGKYCSFNSSAFIRQLGQYIFKIPKQCITYLLAQLQR